MRDKPTVERIECLECGEEYRFISTGKPVSVNCSCGSTMKMLTGGGGRGDYIKPMLAMPAAEAFGIR